MQIELVTKQDFEAFKSELLQAITEYMHQKGGQQEKQWLRTKEVKAMLGISNGTLMNLRIKGLLKPSKIEGVYFYRLSEIKQLLDAGTTEE
ncbi:MAG: hypothetical protein BGO69_14635 [Bacteroidetes bacterium 46-16]|nr:MAG: hypothetical protein BGO69_14635 [Bacteroidetes bacterium 46-16]